jgi:hypothetical protein
MTVFTPNRRGIPNKHNNYNQTALLNASAEELERWLK